MVVRKVFAALFAFALLAAACGDDDGGGGYSQEIRDGYLEGCTGQQNQEFCECTLNELEKQFSEEEFIKFAIEATEEPPDAFIEIAFACLDSADLGG